jgi:hypothetical protein
MSENWLIIDFQDLMKSILNGNRLIQDPISITNKRRDTVSKISFLNLLLSYNNVNKDNLLDVLSNVYKRFHNRINELNQNKIVQNMMDCINQEWYDPDYDFIFDYPFKDNFFDKNTENKPRYDNSCKICEEIKNLSTIENNIPLKIEKDQIHPLDKHFKVGLSMCRETIEYMEKNLEEINMIINNMKNINISQFIDLSIKHKALYLKLSGIDEKEDSIPENIHHIFSNYYHIHNLLLKQLIQYYHYLESMHLEIKERCKNMEVLQKNVHTIAYFEEESDEGEDPLDEIDEEEDDIYIENSEIYHTNRLKDGGKEDSIIKTVINSFF